MEGENHCGPQGPGRQTGRPWNPTECGLSVGLDGSGWSESEILRNCPGLMHDDIVACLAYAGDTVRSERVYEFQPA
jgi:hypothetical protein